MQQVIWRGGESKVRMEWMNGEGSNGEENLMDVPRPRWERSRWKGIKDWWRIEWFFRFFKIWWWDEKSKSVVWVLPFSLFTQLVLLQDLFDSLVKVILEQMGEWCSSMSNKGKQVSVECYWWKSSSKVKHSNSRARIEVAKWLQAPEVTSRWRRGWIKAE